MTKKIRVFTAILGLVLFCGLTLGQEPVLDIDPQNHPHLAKAQGFVVQANNTLALAQKTNKYDIFQGHVDKARLLLVQVNQELKAAALAANASGKKE